MPSNGTYFIGTVSQELWWGIAVYQLKALFMGYCHPSLSFNFFKGHFTINKRRSSYEQPYNSRLSG